MPRVLPPPKGNGKTWLNLLPTEQYARNRCIYMFRNTQTNQIVYALEPKIEVRLQLKHSLSNN